MTPRCQQRNPHEQDYLAVLVIGWGAAHVVIGVPLRRYAARARFIALLLGSVDLLLLPYGTALGVYALWVLLTEDGKKLFLEGLEAQG